jgi:uncharacterized protein with von Willebrand factor type A (vWA) domain
MLTQDLDIRSLPALSDLDLLGIKADDVSGGGLIKAVTALSRTMRENGAGTALPGVMNALRAIAKIGISRADDLKVALGANLACSRRELELFNYLFDRYFLGLTKDDSDTFPVTQNTQGETSIVDKEESKAREENKTSPYSPVEILLNKDISLLQNSEYEDALKLLSEILKHRLKKVSRRYKASGHAERIDFRRTFRRSLDSGGDPFVLIRKKRKIRTRRLALVFDVSGSMDARNEFMIRFADWWIKNLPGKVDVFVFSTRLRKLTRILTQKGLEGTVRHINEMMPEWSGGTRIGACLKELISGTAISSIDHNCVTVIYSDGWDRGDIPLLEKQMERLARKAHSVIWMNPLMGCTEFSPSCAGIKAALPHIDELIPAHNTISLINAGETINRALMK